MTFFRPSRRKPAPHARAVGRHADPHLTPTSATHGATAAIATAVVLGIVLGAGITLAVSWPTGHSDFGASGGNHGGHQRARLSAQSQSSPQSAHQQALADQRQRCIDAVAATQLPLSRAASSIEQWEVHVGAMNKLVAGAITLQQATAFWNRTRVGARHRVESFERAWGRLQRQGLDCPSPGTLPSGSPPQLRSCSREVAANMRVLQAAGTAIQTWRRHVGAMNMLRMGTLSPTTATNMWLAMWHRGQQEIGTYRAAARAAHRVPKCSPAAPSSAS